MVDIVVMGAGLGGMPAAYELKKAVSRGHQVTLVNPSGDFQFTPSNPWVAVGWRKPEEVIIGIAEPVKKRASVLSPRRCRKLIPTTTG